MHVTIIVECISFVLIGGFAFFQTCTESLPVENNGMTRKRRVLRFPKEFTSIVVAVAGLLAGLVGLAGVVRGFYK